MSQVPILKLPGRGSHVNVLVFLVGVLVAATPFIGPYFIKIAAIGLWVLLFLRWLWIRPPLRIMAAEWCVMAFSAWAVAISLLHPPPEFTLSVIIEYGSPAVLFVLVLRTCQTPASWRHIGLFYVVGCALAVGVLVFNRFTGATAEDSSRFTVGELNANYIAYCLLTAVPIVMAILWDQESDMRRNAAHAMIAGFGFGIALTGSRGAAIGFVACLLIIVARALKRQSPYLVAIVPVLVCAWFVVAAVLPEEVLERLTFAEQNPDISSGRFDQNVVAFGLIAERPILGNGPNSFPVYNGDPRQVHNVFLHIAADFGFIGLALFLLAIAVSLVTPLRQKVNWYWSAMAMMVATWLVLALTGVWAVAPAAWFAFAWFYGTAASRRAIGP